MGRENPVGAGAPNATTTPLSRCAASESRRAAYSAPEMVWAASAQGASNAAIADAWNVMGDLVGRWQDDRSGMARVKGAPSPFSVLPSPVSILDNGN